MTTEMLEMILNYKLFLCASYPALRFKYYPGSCCKE